MVLYYNDFLLYREEKVTQNDFHFSTETRCIAKSEGTFLFKLMRLACNVFEYNQRLLKYLFNISTSLMRCHKEIEQIHYTPIVQQELGMAIIPAK